MKPKLLHYLLFALIPMSCVVNAQDISLYEHFNGRYDFVFVGNTLNSVANGLNTPCSVLTSSSASLSLGTGDTVKSAYLYWAGSGTGDFDIKLNGQDITAERDFPLISWTNDLPFFSAFADVTAFVQTTGNGVYTVSELDVSSVLSPLEYCNTGTNFAGWVLVIIYENQALPLNQLNVYDGLQTVPFEVNITLENLNVIDNIGARVGFVAWEGDANLAFSESLIFNGTTLSNPPLNPSNNAFNCTNSFTGATDLYNMDLDVYNIQNLISIGDTTATIKLTSGQADDDGNLLNGDFVMINTVVTKLNSQLPDATIIVDNIVNECNTRSVIANYTVFNLNSTDVLPGGVPIAIFADGIFVGSTATTAAIPIGESQSGQVTLVLPDGIADVFELLFIVDQDNLGAGTVTELVETNNTFTIAGELLPVPGFNAPENLVACNEGLGRGTFDFSAYASIIAVNPGDTISFHPSLEDAENNSNAILDTGDYVANTTPQTIFVRIQGDPCFSITSFELLTRNCPPTVYNYVSSNNDGYNDTFIIDGLRDIFLNFKLSVFNRWGALVWTGNNSTADWDGVATKGILFDARNMPDGTYYYVLELNDPGYPEPLTGFLYLVH